jgi:hypothetical protein
MAKKWQPEDYALTLSMYFAGSGLEAIAEVLDRSVRAVEDVLLDDMPRNYRDVIGRIGPRPDRTGQKYGSHERDYIRTLLGKGRSVSEIALVTGRSEADVEEPLARTRPTRPQRGFGL